MEGTALKIEIVNKGETKECFPEFRGKPVIDTQVYGAVVIEDGTSGGRPSVVLIARGPKGEMIAMQTTGRLLDSLAAAVNGVAMRNGLDS